MKIANGIKIDNENYILASAVSATYDSVGNNISETLETISSKTLPEQPTFVDTKTYFLKLKPNEESTGWTTSWEEASEQLEDADNKEY